MLSDADNRKEAKKLRLLWFINPHENVQMLLDWFGCPINQDHIKHNNDPSLSFYWCFREMGAHHGLQQFLKIQERQKRRI